jgi:hypothetical protein
MRLRTAIPGSVSLLRIARMFSLRSIHRQSPNFSRSHLRTASCSSCPARRTYDVPNMKANLAPGFRINLTGREAAHLTSETVAVQNFRPELCRYIPGNWSLYIYCPSPNFLSSAARTVRCSSCPALRT